jgi:hypothetical protein
MKSLPVHHEDCTCQTCLILMLSNQISDLYKQVQEVKNILRQAIYLSPPDEDSKKTSDS